MSDVDRLCIDTLRFLSVDQVEAAKSGHPGMPLGAAPMGYALFDRFLVHNPADPKWFNRDRFILSAGHGSALLYSILHMTGYALPLEELKRFRQWGSKTPGHPEYGHVPGVEATTGPLGQGFAMGVGMAIAETILAAQFNRPDFHVVDHFTYAIVSDGDLMEGVASEAASLAGHLGLGKLVYLYDDNKISIEGSTDLAFTEDVAKRFAAYGWHAQKVEDGNDVEAIGKALEVARADTCRPSLIIVRTHIGYGSPKQDSADAHGAPLGPEATRKTKEAAGWPVDQPFYIPDAARDHMRKAIERGGRRQREWEELFESYRKTHPKLAASFQLAMKGERPTGWDSGVPIFKSSDGPVATRSASGKVLNALAKTLPTLVGGSADLAPSNNTLISGSADYSPEHREGRNLHFGVRELSMAAAVNGMALHGGILPYGATFLIFSDYARPALRLAALMQTHAIFVFTHDSIGVGEDGPTHQPIEQLMSLRVIPGLLVLRPADANETAAAWRLAVTLKRPVVLALSRQNLPVLDVEKFPVIEGVPRGAYVLLEADGGRPDVVLVATGSEVQLTLGARDKLAENGVKARVVSMPSWELFDEQPETYRKEIFPPSVPTLAVEAGSMKGWKEYADDVLGLDHFGASAPGNEVFKRFGFTVENVVDRALKLLKK